MPRKKKRGFIRTVLDAMTVVSFIIAVLSLVCPNIFVIRYIVHERIINIDATNAFAHPTASLSIGISATVTIQNSSGTYVNGVRSNDSANDSIQNTRGTDISSVGSSGSVTKGSPKF